MVKTPNAPTALGDPGYHFYSEGFENSDKPCLTVADPQGGDPRILARMDRVHNREAIWEMVRLANAAATMAQALVFIGEMRPGRGDDAETAALYDGYSEAERRIFDRGEMCGYSRAWERASDRARAGLSEE